MAQRVFVEISMQETGGIKEPTQLRVIRLFSQSSYGDGQKPMVFMWHPTLISHGLNYLRRRTPALYRGLFQVPGAKLLASFGQ